MRRLKLLGILIAVVGTTAAIAAGPASAANLEFFPSHDTFKLSGGAVQFHAAGTTYGCSSSSGEGTTTVQGGTASLTLKGCSIQEGTTCQSTGAAAGEIRTGSLPIQLVYRSKSTHQLGIVFNYGGASPFASWTCAFFSGLGVKGSILVPIAANKAAHSYAIEFAETAGHLQTPVAYEGPSGELLGAVPTFALVSKNYVEGAMTGKFTLTPGVELEARG